MVNDIGMARAGMALSGTLLWSGLWLILTSFFRQPWMAVFGIFCYSISIPVVLAGVSGLMQLLSPSDMRGRLLSVSSMLAPAAE